MVQSTWPTTPSRTGAPVVEVVQATPANLSAPRVAKVLESSCWPSARKLTQKKPARRISGQAREVFAGTNITSGGSSETLENDWQVRPTGSPPATEVTTVTPEQNRPRVSRNSLAAATATGSSRGTEPASPGHSPVSKVPRNESISSRGGQVVTASGLIPAGISTSSLGRCGIGQLPPNWWPQ